MLALYDRVKETTVTTGTGSVTLAGAVTGYRTFTSVLATNATTYYVIEGGSEWEVGFGTLTSSTVLARTTVIASSNANALVSFSAGTKNVFIDCPAENVPPVAPSLCEGRLTLTTAVPVTTADVTSAAAFYFTPYKGSRISLYDGNRWKLYNFTELNIAVSGLTVSVPYDVFAYDNSGAVACEYLSWIDAVTRATALVLQDGIYCKSGALTRKYLGTFVPTSSAGLDDNMQKRLLWNNYNRVPRRLRKVNSAVSWTYNSTTFRQTNADNTLYVRTVMGLADSPVLVTHRGYGSAPGGSTAAVGIGLDRTNGNDAKHQNAASTLVGGSETFLLAVYDDYPSAGYHSWNMVEG